MNGWVLHDVAEAKKHYTFDTHPAIGIKTEWGKTITFHPDLESTMDRVKAGVYKRL